MPVTGKELEPKISADELAANEVESYIERTEKAAEVKPQVPVAGSQPMAVADPAALSDAAAKKAIGVAPRSAKQKIVLPLDEEEVKRGLHHKVIDALRWLAEWSVYMIKKYPGRVFYRPKNT